METHLDHYADSKSTMNLLLIAVIGGIGLYALSKIGQGAAAVVSGVSTAAADLWVSLTSSAPINVLGNVALPDGSVAAISSLTWKSDNQGNAYTQLSDGHVYELAARDANGNFTLSQVA